MEDQEFNLRGVIATLRRQAWVILLTIVVVVGIAGAIVLSIQPIYRASALVLVDPSDKNLLEPSTTSASGSAENARVESEVTIARAETTLGQVVDTLKLVENPDFQPSPGLREQVMVMIGMARPRAYDASEIRQHAISKLRSSTAVDRQGLTYLLSISARAASPDQAAELANALARTYIRTQLQSKVDSVLSGRDVMASRVSETRSSLVAAEQAFSDFILSSAAMIAESTGRTDLDQLRLELENAVLTRERIEVQIRIAEAGLQAEDWLQVANTLESASLRQLQQRQQELERDLAQAVSGSETADALRRELLAVVDNTRTQASSEIDQLRAQVAESRARSADLQIQLRSAILTSNLPPDVLANMFELQQNADIARTQYQQMLTRLRDIEAQAYLQIADSRVVSDATPPPSAAFPNVSITLLIAGLGAMLAGTVLAFVRENFVGGVVEPDQLESLSGSTQVATLINQPRLGKGTTGRTLRSPTEMIAEQPYSPYTESVRRLMIMVDQVLRKSKRQNQPARKAALILVTSANTNEGKTTVSVSLARAYALTGRSTILIDADLRQPSIHADLGLQPSASMSRYLEQNNAPASLAPFLVSDELSNLKILVSGVTPESASNQVVSGEKFSQLLKKAGNEFEIVIIDTPPVGAVVDALYLTQFADVVVNVVRFGTTIQREVSSAVREIQDALQRGASIVHVLNAMPQRKGENRRRFKGYYST